MNQHRFLVAFVIFVMLAASFAPSPSTGQSYSVTGIILYVDADATGTNDGLSWENAYTALQPALDKAITGDQVWVAEGDYLPTIAHCGEGERNKSFQLKNGVAIYGGFDPSTGDDTWEERDWKANVTNLSGELGDPNTNSDNSYHVLCHPASLSLDSSAILDGFTVLKGMGSGGDLEDRGGGMYNASASPTLANITFAENGAVYGGGMYNSSSSPTLVNIAFFVNGAVFNGGGMYNIASSPVLTNTIFIGNNAYSGAGAGMYNTDASAPKLVNVAFRENLSTIGAGMYNYASSPVLINCTFNQNSASTDGGGLYNQASSSPTLTNCILWKDTPNEIVDINSYPVITYSDIQGGYDGLGNIDKDPLFIDIFHIYLQSFSPVIDAGNNAAPGLDGITTDLDGNPRFVDVIWMKDSGNGTPPIVDMGAYEHQSIVYYVDVDATGANDGSSWEDAYTTLQPAMQAATSGDHIWVAAGTYLPTVNHCGASERHKSFQLTNGIEVYGGFDPSAGDRTWENRNWVENATVLSGDIGTQGDKSDNSYHVFCNIGADVGAAPILNGFTIQDGNANSSSDPDFSGGGMYNDGYWPVLTNISFVGNTASGYGGGIYNDRSDSNLTNVTFSGNTASYGGGMNNLASSPMLTNVIFNNNSADYGGGMRNDYNTYTQATLTNVTFANNSATYDGGGMYNDSSSPNLINNILWGNTPDQIFNDSSTPVVIYSDIHGGYEGTGNIYADPLFVDADSGNLRLQRTSPAIDAGDNTAPVLAGITTDLDNAPRFVDVPWIEDTGNGTPPIVDMGAYEYQPIIFVDVYATGATDGSSWEDAYTDLQTALEAVKGSGQIWVAAGTYYPSVEHCATGDARFKSFQLQNGVAVYGGFDPVAGDDTWEERDWMGNITILSGDIGIEGNKDDNSYHVLCHSGIQLDSSAVLDGFSIRDGNAITTNLAGAGGGMYNDASSPSLVNLIFSNNFADWGGGGLYNSSSSPTLTNVTFSNNTAKREGGGMSNLYSTPLLTNVTFSGNNVVEGIGGGMNNYESSPILINVTFSSNFASSGGGLFNGFSSSPTLTNVTFTGNKALLGGGLTDKDSSSTLTNCILWGDIPNEINTAEGTTTVVTYSDVQGGHAGEGNISTDPLLGTLVDNGGVVFTHALGFNSPAIDTGNPNQATCPPTDARGASRPVDGDGDGVAVCDMGAYEYQIVRRLLPLMYK